METSEKVPIFARLNVKGGIPSPLHNPPMRIEVFPHGFVYSLKTAVSIAAVFSVAFSAGFEYNSQAIA